MSFMSVRQVTLEFVVQFEVNSDISAVVTAPVSVFTGSE